MSIHGYIGRLEYFMTLCEQYSTHSFESGYVCCESLRERACLSRGGKMSALDLGYAYGRCSRVLKTAGHELDLTELALAESLLWQWFYRYRDRLVQCGENQIELSYVALASMYVECLAANWDRSDGELLKWTKKVREALQLFAGNVPQADMYVIEGILSQGTNF